MRDIETIDAELLLVAAFRRAARERGGPLPSIDVADALLDERRELTERCRNFSTEPRLGASAPHSGFGGETHPAPGGTTPPGRVRLTEKDD